MNQIPSSRILLLPLASLALVTMFSCTGNSSANSKPNYITKDAAPRPGVLAKIGDEEITEEMLIGDEKSSFFELQKREYELRMQRIERLLVEKLVGAEAKKAGMSLDDYLNKKVLSGDVKIPDAEYNAFVKREAHSGKPDQRAAEGSHPPVPERAKARAAHKRLRREAHEVEAG